MTIWLQKSRKNKNLDFIRIKNEINKVPDNFITETAYGHPHYNTVDKKYDDIFFLSKRNKRYFYNTTVTTAIEELSRIIYTDCWEKSNQKYKLLQSDYHVYIDPTTNLRKSSISDEAKHKLFKLVEYKDTLIKESIKDYTLDISNKFMYNYNFGIGLELVIPSATTLNNDLVNEHIIKFWNYDEGYNLQKFTITEDELAEYLYSMMYISEGKNICI